jgi:hypothetical protein
MVLRPATDGSVAGSNLALKLRSGVIGGVLISADGSDAVTVTIIDGNGNIAFQLVTAQPAFIIGPIKATKDNTLTVSGTGGSAMIYEWVY